MSTWTQMDRRIGMWSAIAMVLITVTFIITGAIWLVTNIASLRSQGLEQSEPLLTILETLIVLSTPAIVALFTAIHAYAPLNKKTCSLTAFGFAVLLAGITGMVHFVQLTAVRRTANKNVAEVFALYDPGGKLTPMLAIDLLAWDFFLGFGLLFAATLFKGDKLQAAIRVSMILSGLLCLAGVSGPASGNFWLQYPAIVGCAFVFPFVCLLLAMLFARSSKPVDLLCSENLRS